MKENNKTLCIYHSVDLDGWMSAAIVKHWFISKNKTNFILNEDKITCSGNPELAPQINFMGYNYGNPIPNLSEYDRVIMCDISFPDEKMWQIQETIGYDNFVWLDHHISAINNIKNHYKEHTLDHIVGIRDTKFAACELTWAYFFPDDEIPEIVRLLGRYDCFGHKGTEEEQKVLEFQYGARTYITDYNIAFNFLMNDIHNSKIKKNEHGLSITTQIIWSDGKVIYKYLCTEAKQIYKNGFPITFTIHHIDNYVENLKFLAINRERFNPINFDINYHKDGYDGCACFWYQNGKWNFSLYNDNEKVDCSHIAKYYGGGGHKGAAGFMIDDIYKIINIKL